MAIALGDNSINKAYLGTTEIQKMYLGSDILFDNSVNADYYVSFTDGLDTNLGTLTEPWKTLSKVQTEISSADAGKTIAFKNGDTWNEVFTLNNDSGTVGNEIVFTSYGSGAKPVFSTVNVQNPTWINKSVNIWYQADITSSPKRIIIDGAEVMQGDYAELGTNVSESGTDPSGLVTWCRSDQGDGGTYMYVYSTTDPNNRIFEFTNDSRTMLLYQANNLIFNNIEFKGGYNETITLYECTNVTFDGISCGDMSYIGLKVFAIGANMSSNIIVKNSDFDTKYTLDYFGAAIDSMESRGPGDGILYQGCIGGEIHNNTGTNWGHAAIGLISEGQENTISNIKVYRNITTCPDLPYGRGIATGMSSRDNEVYDNGIIETRANNKASGLRNHWHHNKFIDCKTSVIKSHQTGYGLTFQTAAAVYNPEPNTSCQYNIVENNIFINCNSGGFKTLAGYTAEPLRFNTLRNNISYECGSANDNIALEIGYYADMDNGQNTYQNNVFYSSLENNVVSYPTSETTRELITVDEFNAKNGDVYLNTIESNLQSNPLFGVDFALTEFSPAVNNGNIILATTDYAGNTIPYLDTRNDIGIYESEYLTAPTTPDPEAPTYGTVGFTDADALTLTSSAGQLRAMSATMSENGTLQSVSMHATADTNNDLILGVYSDSGLAPDALLATTELAPSITTGWNTFDLVEPLYLESGTNIWLAFSSQSISLKYEAIGGGAQRASAAVSGLQSPLPDPFGDNSVAEFTYAIYSTYIVGVTPPEPTGSKPVLSNFAISNASPGIVTFDASKDITGMTITGFVISNKTISGLTIDGDGLGGYFTVTEDFDFWDNTTIRLGEITDTSHSQSVLYDFSLEYIENNINEPDASTYRYVSLTGDNGNDGLTEGQAWRTLAYGWGQLSSGMTLWVKAGDYGNDKVITYTNGTPTAPIKIIGYKTAIGDGASLNWSYADTSPWNYNDPLAYVNGFDAAELPLISGTTEEDIASARGFEIAASNIIVKNIQMQFYGRGFFVQTTRENVWFDNCYVACTTYGFMADAELTKRFRCTNSVSFRGATNCIRSWGSDALVDNCQLWDDRDDEASTPTALKYSTDYYIGIEGHNSIFRNNHAERVGNTTHDGHGYSVKGSNYSTQHVLVEKSTVMGINLAIEFSRVNTKYCVAKDVQISRQSATTKGDTGGITFLEKATWNLAERILVTDVNQGIFVTPPSDAKNNFVRNSIFDNCTMVIRGTGDSQTMEGCTIVNCGSMATEAATWTVIDTILSETSRGTDSLFSYSYCDFHNSGTLPSGTGNILTDPQLDVNYVPGVALVGTPVYGLEYDYDEVERNETTPTIGAKEVL